MPEQKNWIKILRTIDKFRAALRNKRWPEGMTNVDMFNGEEFTPDDLYSVTEAFEEAHDIDDEEREIIKERASDILGGWKIGAGNDGLYIPYAEYNDPPKGKKKPLINCFDSITSAMRYYYTNKGWMRAWVNDSVVMYDRVNGRVYDNKALKLLTKQVKLFKKWQKNEDDSVVLKTTPLADKLLEGEDEGLNLIRALDFRYDVPPEKEFDEEDEGVVTHKYNTWRGFAVKPRSRTELDPDRPGDRKIINALDKWDKLFKEGICGNRQEIIDYMSGWMAHLYQYPSDKPPVLILLTGYSGCGKTVFFDLHRHIMGSGTGGEGFTSIDDPKQMEDKFSAFLVKPLLCVLNEWKHAKNVVSVVKGMVTETRRTVEEKYEKKKTIRTYTRYVMVSNNKSDLANIEKSDRRNFMFSANPEFSPHYWRDSGTTHQDLEKSEEMRIFFQELCGETGEMLRAIAPFKFHDFLHYDLHKAGWNAMIFPNTVEKDEMLEDKKPLLQVFIEELIAENNFPRLPENIAFQINAQKHWLIDTSPYEIGWIEAGELLQQVNANTGKVQYVSRNLFRNIKKVCGFTEGRDVYNVKLNNNWGHYYGFVLRKKDIKTT